MNENLIKIMDAIPIIKAVVSLLIAVIAVMLIMRLFNVRSLMAGKGIADSLENIDKSRSRDHLILSSNKFLVNISKLVQRSPFGIGRTEESYLDYNLSRANWRAPGGMRVMNAKEFNALKVIGTSMLMLSGLIVALLVNHMLGIVAIVVSLIGGIMIPTQILRSVVKTKDDEIEEFFPDLYLMLHYVLYSGAKTPIESVMRTFAKTTDSEELKRFIDVAGEYMSTYGEHEATKYIISDYREVESVCELMKLIKQSYDGAEIKNDLLAFRKRVVDKREVLLTKRMDKLVARARRSFILIMLILFQAIVSAMAIYLPDMSGMSSLM